MTVATLGKVGIRLRRLISRLITLFAGVCLLVLVCLACIQVVLRYVFAESLVWMEDVSVIIMAWMIWAVAVSMWVERAHIAMDVLIEKAKPATRRRLLILADVVIIAGGLGLIVAMRDTYRAFSGLELASLPIDMTVKLDPMLFGTCGLIAAGFLDLWRIFAGDAADDL